MQNKIQQLLNHIKNYLHELYGDKICEVILYGSYARGDNTKDSDIDIVILVNESLDVSEVRKNLSNLLFDILLENGELVSVMVLHDYFFKNSNYPFMLNVRKEGLRV